MSRYYEGVIAKIDPKVNAKGVEEHMRLQYGTLDHLPHSTFVAEVKLAKECERAQPGYLKMCAEGC